MLGVAATRACRITASVLGCVLAIVAPLAAAAEPLSVHTTRTGAHAGLGHEINADLTALQTPRAYAAAVVLFAFAIVCFYALALAERRLAPWAAHSPGARG